MPPHNAAPLPQCPIAPKTVIARFPQCDRRECAFNYSEGGQPSCVLWPLSKLDTVTERIDLLEAKGLSTPAILSRHIEELTAAAADFSALSQTPNPSTACPNCGYVTKCVSSSLCDTRRSALDPLAEAASQIMTRYQIWDAVLNNRARFLPESFVRRDLAPLLSKPANTRKAVSQK